MYQIKSFLDIINLYGEVYLVGGSIRDILMDNEPKDFDFEVHYINIPEFLLLCDTYKIPYKLVGASFGVYILTIDEIDYEFSFPRKERQIGKNHTDFEITIDPFMGVKEAQLRRDFSCNAIYYSTKTNKIIDNFNGQQDIENNILYPISIYFVEDNLRVLRAFRFLSKYNWKPSEELLKICPTMSLDNISKERIEEEFIKWSKTNYPENGIKFLYNTGLIKYFPIIDKLDEIPQGIKYHPEGNVLNHTLQVLSNIRLFNDLTEDEHSQLVFAALLHDTGKLETTVINGESFSEKWRFYQPTENDIINSYQHENYSALNAYSFFEQLNPNYDKHNISAIYELCLYHMRISQTYTTKSLRKLKKNLAFVTLKQLIRLMIMDKFNREHEDGINHLWKVLEEIETPIYFENWIVTGKKLLELGYKHSEQFHFGKIIEYAKEAQIDGELTKENYKEWIVNYQKGVI